MVWVQMSHESIVMFFASIPQNNFSSEPLLCIFDAVVQIWLRPHVSFSVIHMQQTPTPEHLSRECKCIVCIFNSTPLHSCCLNRHFPDIAAGRTSNKHSGCMFTARHSKTKKDEVTSIMYHRGSSTLNLSAVVQTSFLLHYRLQTAML